VRYLYLHGLASGPNSSKGRFFGEKLAGLGLDLTCPDLNEPDFRRMTLTSQLAVVQGVLGSSPEPVTLLGSSMGGLIAVLTAIQDSRIERLFLLAPAFKFFQNWTTHLGPEVVERWRATGSLDIYHYAHNLPMPLGYAIIEDAQHHDEQQLTRSLPVLIVHGLEDETVPPEVSITFAKGRPDVQVTFLHSDHRLTDVQGQIWALFSHWAGLG
jgi:uncharacterized protein